MPRAPSIRAQLPVPKLYMQSRNPAFSAEKDLPDLEVGQGLRWSKVASPEGW
jgi:hypothetical protein